MHIFDIWVPSNPIKQDNNDIDHLPVVKILSYEVELDEDRGMFSVEDTAVVGVVSQFGFKCTQEEAKKYPQFRWVALEDL